MIPMSHFMLRYLELKWIPLPFRKAVRKRSIIPVFQLSHTFPQENLPDDWKTIVSVLT